MAGRKFARTFLAAGTLVACGLAQPAAAATAVASNASALEINLAIANKVAFSVGDLAFVGATAPPNLTYSSSSSLTRYAYANVVGDDFFALISGALADKVFGTYSPLAGTATSMVQGLDSVFTLGAFTFGGSGSVTPLLEISAATISSSTMVTDVTGLTFAGTTKFDNLTISGSAVGKAIMLGTKSVIPANDVLFNAAGLAIVANYQTPYFDGAKEAGVQTSALALIFNHFAFGTDYLFGSLRIANSSANILDAPGVATSVKAGISLPLAAVPEPGTWATMLIGLGLAGSAMRRQNGKGRKLASLPLPAL